MSTLRKSTQMEKLNITLLYGSYREDRMGVRAVYFLEALLKAKGHSVNFVDAKALKLPILSKRYVDYAPGTAPKDLEDLKTLFEKNTDAFIVVSGEYNGTLQPGLKNLLDHFYMEYFHKPSGMVTYSVGGLGGSRVSMDLRNILGIFGMPAIPCVLAIPAIHDKLDEAGNDASGSLAKSTEKFINELVWYGTALKAQRIKGLPA